MYALGGSFAGEDGAEPSAEDLAISVLDRLAVSRVAKSGDALDVLAAEVRSDEKDEVLDMVVVDSLDTLVGGEALASGSAQAHANLIAFMRRLATLARSKSAPLTVITVTSLGIPSAKGSNTAPIPPNLPQQPPPLSSLPHPIPLKPALGSTFAYLVDISLVVSPAEPLFGPDDGRDRGFVEVARNVRGETGGMVEFKLHEVTVTFRPSSKSLEAPDSRSGQPPLFVIAVATI
ncbi:hypothetical protein Rhopal_001170-T1 [Rhodotorula paludigena]|uniref:DNA recombination and repair protein Rad51-like C-terminal domain-containing protein n=1 Tax=Rhodotorula paludigena TaxID=86838 RepID=A0AAV5G6V9_9BASI|nr:hypothetical protein Rhopal_001170-T1 [Rhodotorula paludigena]